MAEPLVVEAVDQNNTQYQGLQLFFSLASRPLSRKTLNYVAGLIRRHRKSIGSRWRKLDPGQQGLLVLAYLRKGETFADLAAGFGVGAATAWRYIDEAVALLAACAPQLRKAVRDAKSAGHAYVILDGTLIPIDRVARDRPFYSGKHKRHGMNLQVIASPDGDILWVSGALPRAGSLTPPSAMRSRAPQGGRPRRSAVQASGPAIRAGPGRQARKRRAGVGRVPVAKPTPALS